MNDKQSIWCEITIKNYKDKFPLLKDNNLCPICSSKNIECYISNHKTKFKYFYAYPFKKKVEPYLYDNCTNVFYIVDDID
jgi:chlorite dismutase